MSYRKNLTERISRTVGRPPVFKTPQELWEAFCAYVTEVDNNAVDLPQSFVKGQNNKLTAGRVSRPLTLQGFMAFCGMGQSWGNYKYSHKEKPEFSQVIKNIELVVTADQLEGGLSGIYNSNLTARLNGLSEHNNISTSKPLDLKFEIINGESE